MSKSVNESLRNCSEKAFVVQFVLSVKVDTSDEIVLAIKSFLFHAASEDEVRGAAQEMSESLNDRYRNRVGEPVTVRYEGVHSVTELIHVDADGWLELGTFQFSKFTRSCHLVDGGKREDLPLLE